MTEKQLVKKQKPIGICISGQLNFCFSGKVEDYYQSKFWLASTFLITAFLLIKVWIFS